MRPKRILKFKNYAEEANFWDTHDVTDYLPEMKFRRKVPTKTEKGGNCNN